MFNKKRIMNRAWTIAWNAYFEGDRVGSVKEYFSGSLKMAWAEAKEKEAKKIAKKNAASETVAFVQANAGDYETLLQFVKNMTHNGKITGGTVVTTACDMFGNSSDVYHITFGETAEAVAHLLARLTDVTAFELSFMTPEQEAERKAKNEVSRQNARHNAEQIRQNVYDNF